MSGFKKTEIGIVPENWQVVELGTVCNQRKEIVTPNSNGKGNYVGLEHIQPGVFRLKNYGNEGEVKSAKHKFYDGDILYGKLRPYLDKAVLVNLSGICSTDIIVLKGTEQLLQSYLIGLVHTNYFIEYSKRTTSGVNHPRTSWNSLKKFKFGLPTLEEQRNIAYILSKIQSAIETQEKIIRTTTELKKALMQKLFTEGLHGEPQKETEIGRVPESWEVVPLEQTGEVVYGIQAAVANLTKPIGTKILTNINITFDGKIDLTQLRYYPLTKQRHFKTILQKGDILFNWRSGSKDHVGKTAFFDLDGEFTHSSFILRIRTNKELSNKYLFYYLTHLRSSGYFDKLQNYSVNAKFNASAVNALPTALPDYDEQLEIANILTTVDLKIKSQTGKLKLFKTLFKSMLHHLMTGQIRVKDLRLS